MITDSRRVDRLIWQFGNHRLRPVSDWAGASGWRDAYEEGRSLWPSIAVSREAFEAHALATAGPEPCEHATELYLAFACSCGDARAISVLEEQYLAPARICLFRVDPRPEFIDDAMQELRTKLLVGTGARIRAYGGRGPLLAWLRVAVTRTAIDMVRALKPATPIESDSDDGLGNADLGPEVRMLRELYRASFRTALAETLRALSAKDRNLLRRHLVDKLTLEEIAAPYGVHLATVARRLASLREDIGESVRERLAAAFPDTIGSTSLESMAHAIRSEVSLSLTTLLASTMAIPATKV